MPSHQSSTQSGDAEAKPDRVRFELGGDDDDDDDDDEDDEENNTSNRANNGQPSERPSTSSDAASSQETDSKKSVQRTECVKRTTGLGQITRDSLSILHGDEMSSHSRDSMRSLESLTEIDNNVFK